MGDAGAIVTSDEALARRIAMFARHGGLTKGEHQIEGINSRLDGLQAGILTVKLEHLPAWTRARQAIAARYSARISNLPGLTTPTTAAGREHVFHLYVVRHNNREGLARHLKARGIQTVINYPVALPFLRAYAHLHHQPNDFPVAYRNQSRILSLPIYPEMTETQFNHVVTEIENFSAQAS
jgi:dTDP-4-amino-4,6-dideoxygalactose transaminase